MTTNELALEPCSNPWCPTHGATDPEIAAAEAPILMPSKSSNEWAVACPVCPIQTPWFASEAEAIAAWNQRPQPDGDAVERACDAFMSKITVDGNGGIEFLEEGILAAIAAMPAKGRDDVLEEAALRDIITECAADLSTEEPFWTAGMLADRLIAKGIRALKSGGR